MNKKVKRMILLVIFALALFIVFNPIANAENINYGNICTDTRLLNVLKIIGYVINFVKIMAPLIIIVLGMIDFGQATISNDDKAISKAANSLLKRFIAGIVIFFIPTIISLISSTLTNLGFNLGGDFDKCTKCVLDISEC